MTLSARVAIVGVGLAALLTPLQILAASTPPDAPMIGQAYYRCDQPRMLEGGNYGKGPFRRFGPTDAKRDCPRWVKISEDEFKVLATDWFSHDWNADLPFWGER